VQLYFKYQSAGKYGGEFLSSGDGSLNNVCSKGNKIVNNCNRLRLCRKKNAFLLSVSSVCTAPQLLFFSDEAFSLRGQANYPNIPYLFLGGGGGVELQEK